eukprot:Opistho-1_new@38446
MRANTASVHAHARTTASTKRPCRAPQSVAHAAPPVPHGARGRHNLLCFLKLPSHNRSGRRRRRRKAPVLERRLNRLLAVTALGLRRHAGIIRPARCLALSGNRRGHLQNAPPLVLPALVRGNEVGGDEAVAIARRDKGRVLLDEHNRQLGTTTRARPRQRIAAEGVVHECGIGTVAEEQLDDILPAMIRCTAEGAPEKPLAHISRRPKGVGVRARCEVSREHRNVRPFARLKKRLQIVAAQPPRADFLGRLRRGHNRRRTPSRTPAVRPSICVTPGIASGRKRRRCGRCCRTRWLFRRGRVRAPCLGDRDLLLLPRIGHSGAGLSLRGTSVLHVVVGPLALRLPHVLCVDT